jgi:hypothetical protein
MEATKEIVISKKITTSVIEKIESDGDMLKATGYLSVLNKELDRIIADKEKITKPLNQTLKEVRGRYKPAEEFLSEKIESVRKMMSVFRTQQKALVESEAAKIAARVGEGKGKLKFETASDKIDALAKPEKVLGTENGAVTFRTIKKFELTDIKSVPIEYLELNEMMVKEAMKNSIEIPGIRYFTEEIPYNSH